MPLPPLTFDEVRQVDRDAIEQLGIPGLLLMENAARGACQVIHRLGPFRRIVIVAGPGNNGGDGLAIARLLAADSIPSETLLIRGGKNLSADAASNHSFLLRSGIPLTDGSAQDVGTLFQGLTPQDLIVDAILGTGIRGVVASPFSDVIYSVNQSSANVLAVDLPSGMNGDTGLPCGICVQADHTVTFVAEKTGFQKPEARQLTGPVTVCPIGLPQAWLAQWYDQLTKSKQRSTDDDRR